MNEDPFNIGMQGGFGRGIERNASPAGFRRRFGSSDKSIEEYAEMRLKANSELQNAQVHLSVKDGVATLTGTVLSGKIKDFIEDDVEKVPGVEAVDNRLRVESPDGPAL